MATIDKTVKITDAQQEAAQRVVDRENPRIAAENAVIEANKQLAIANDTPYVGPEPTPLLTLDLVVQRWVDTASRVDEETATRDIARELAQTFIHADPAVKQQMMADMAKYRQPGPTTRPGRPGRR